MKISKEDGITPYFMNVLEIRDQLQELGCLKKMTTIVLNALLEEWGHFTSSIFGNIEATILSEIWSLCKIEETRLKAKRDVGVGEQIQAFASMAKRKGNFGNSSSHKKKKNMSRFQCYKCQEYGKYKRYCLKFNKDNKRKEINEAHITEEVEERDEKL